MATIQACISKSSEYDSIENSKHCLLLKNFILPQSLQGANVKPASELQSIQAIQN